MKPTQRSLLIAASAEHAATCAARLGLHSDDWDFLAHDGTFRLHHGAAQIVLCLQSLTPELQRLLNRLQITIDDAQVLHDEGEARLPRP